MRAKGYITGNDAADRILRGEVPLGEKALRRVLLNERYRLLAEIRGRFSRRADPCHECDNSEHIFAIFDELEPGVSNEATA